MREHSGVIEGRAQRDKRAAYRRSTADTGCPATGPVGMETDKPTSRPGCNACGPVRGAARPADYRSSRSV